MYISCLLCRFHLHLVPNANPISSGIWALDKVYSRLLELGSALVLLSDFDPIGKLMLYKYLIK